jgi:hypothetical protein
MLAMRAFSTIYVALLVAVQGAQGELVDSGMFCVILLEEGNLFNLKSAATYNRIVSHWKYATSAYQDSCTYPNGQTLIKTVRYSEFA